MRMSDAEFRSILAQGLGEASMCWDPKPSHQVFDSMRAVDILDRLVEGLREKKAAVKAATMVKYTKKRQGALKGQPDPYPLYDDPLYRSEVVKAAFVQQIKGGKADHKKLSDFDPSSIKKGKKVEREHTNSGRLATEIAMDHLTEDPRYYEKLQKMEKKAALRRKLLRKHDNNLSTEQQADPITEDPYRFPRLSQMEKEAMMHGFADELEKLGVGFLRNLGTRIVSSVGRRAGSWGDALLTAPVRTYQATKESILHPAQTMRQGWQETWSPMNPKTRKRDTGLTNRAFFLGGTALAGSTVFPKKDPMGRDESRLTRGMRFAAGTATGLMGMKRGIIPSIALGIGGDVAGGYAGRAIDKVRGRKMKPKKDAPGPLMPNRVAGPVAAIPEGHP